MEETLKKAFDIANYMSVLSNQRHILKEEFKQNLIHYENGGTFTVTKELINFVNTLVSLGNTEDIVIVDDNDQPVNIEDLQSFFKTIVDIYQEAVNDYYTKYQKIKSNRTVEGLL